MIKYSISILALDNLDLTRKCIDSVMRNSKDYELILTDNGSTDGTKEYFESLYRQNPETVTVISHDQNLGFQRPNIEALAIADGALFVLLNNDSEVPPNWLELLEAPFKDNPKVALSGPVGTCCALHSDFRGYPSRNFEYLEGSCLMCKTEIVRKHGLFSPNLYFAYCVPPETLILMADRTEKRIDEINENDFVISHTGIPRRVLSVLKRPYEGELVEITAYGVRKLRCTPEHRVLVFRESQEFIQANTVVVKDRVGRVLTKPPHRSIGPRVAKLLGWYTAEGNIIWSRKTGEPCGLNFTLGLHEQETSVREIESLCNELSLRPCRTYKQDHTMIVRCLDPILAHLMFALAGSGARTKVLDESLFSSDEEAAKNFVRSFIAGDGYVRRDSLRCMANIASGQLARQIAELCTEQGAIAGVSDHHNPQESFGAGRPCARITISRRSASRLLGLQPPTQAYKGRAFIQGSTVRRTVRSVARVHYSGQVWNLEVEEDHSYVANGLAVHNCEDADLSLRMRELGYSIHQVPFTLKHQQGATSRKIPGIEEIQESNRAVMQQRWGHYARVRRFDYPIVLKRTAAIGDVLLLTPIIRALKEQRPLSPIGVHTQWPELFFGNSNVSKADKNLQIPKDSLVIDFTMSYENETMTHIVDAYAKVAGLDKWDRKTELFGVSTLPEFSEERWCAMHVGPTTWAGKTWPLDRFQQVSDWMRSEGWKIVLVGNPSAWHFNCDVDLRGRTTIGYLAAVLKSVKLMIAVDSFPLHAAQAVGTPVVGIFGATLPEFILTEGSPHIGVAADPNIPCAGERHRIKGATYTPCAGLCVASVQVEQVIEAIREILSSI